MKRMTRMGMGEGTAEAGKQEGLQKGEQGSEDRVQETAGGETTKGSKDAKGRRGREEPGSRRTAWR